MSFTSGLFPLENIEDMERRWQEQKNMIECNNFFKTDSPWKHVSRL